jgi:flavin-dependent dehydrogenase
MELISAHRHSWVTLQEPDLIIERQRLIELLARKAIEQGAKIYLGFRFLGIEDKGKNLPLSLENVARGREHTIATNLLVGADGVFSNVATATSRNSHETVTIVQAKVALPKKISRDSVKVWFDREQTEFFYWLIPESEARGVVGLISRNGQGVRENLEGFLESQGCEPLNFQTARVPLHDPLLKPSSTISNSRILLIGDAGGQVKATTVGGVVAGLRGAGAAVRAVVAQVPYRKTVQGLKAELDLHSLMRVVLNRFDDRDYDRLLELLNTRTRDLLATHNRDEFKSAFFRLILTQPRLLFLVANSLLSMRASR